MPAASFDLSMLEPAFVKASSTAALKAIGWGGHVVRNRLADRKLEQLTVNRYRDVATIVDTLPPDTAKAVLQYLKSPEFEELAFGLALAGLRKVSARESAEQRKRLMEQCVESLRLALSLPIEAIEPLAEPLFESLEEAVGSASVIARGGRELPAATRAALVKSTGSIGAATARNGELLRTLEDVASIRVFSDDLRNQVRAMHGSMRLPHAGTSRLVPYERLFVQPSVATQDKSGEGPTAQLAVLVAHCLRTVLLGDPGGGKSTSSLKLIFDVASDKVEGLEGRVPFLVVLRDYVEGFTSARTSVLDYLESLARTPYSVEPPPGAVEYLLLNGRAVVVFDGLDELLDTSLRREVVETVEGFAHRFPTVPILVTSRRVGYEEAALDPDLFAAAELREFNEDQVEAYVRKWFSLDEGVAPARKDQLAESFLKDSYFVADLRVNPLMLSLMCGIYATENYIPRNRPDVYEKCALLLFDRWDKQRGINAPLSFDAHVQAAMRSLALWLYPQQEAQTGMPREKLVTYMKRYLHEKRFDDEVEAERAAAEFIDFCKGRAWVLTDVGAELYGFTHRTFLEYFAASQLVRLHPGPSELLKELRPHLLNAGWDVVAQLALQILGRSVEDGADDFLVELIRSASDVDDPVQRGNLISFAARALGFVVPRPEVLRAIVAAAVEFHCREEWHKELDEFREAPHARLVSSDLISASAENLPLLSRYLAEAVAARLEKEKSDARALLLGYFMDSYVRRDAAAVRADAEYWRAWAAKQSAELDNIAKYQANLYVWVASRRAEELKVSLQDVVRIYGVRALYDYHAAGSVLEAPIAYRLVSTAFYDEATGRVLLADLVAQVPELLLTARRPWVPRDVHYRRLADVLRFGRPTVGGRKNKELMTAALLCALPLMEIMAVEMTRGSAEHPSRWRVFSDVFAEKRRISRSSLAALGLSGSARDFVDAWLGMDISTLGRNRSGTLSAKPRS